MGDATRRSISDLGGNAIRIGDESDARGCGFCGASSGRGVGFTGGCVSGHDESGGALVFFRVLWTEFLKLKRTLALWMVFIAPVVVLALQFLIAYQGNLARRGGDPWNRIAE